jgi:hypothetical protein
MMKCMGREGFLSGIIDCGDYALLVSFLESQASNVGLGEKGRLTCIPTNDLSILLN